jgi:quinohemoprotein ethanol dehydrogenase
VAAKVPDIGTPGALVAWDPVAGKERWRVDHVGQNNGGLLTTHGNLVFQGTAEGRFVAYSADKGEKLWEADLGSGIMAAPATYELDGKQYVTVLAGWGGATAQFGRNWDGLYKAQGRVWTFVLDGSAAVPVEGQQKPELTAIAVDAPQATVDRGAQVYGRWCAMCHGVNVASGGTIADLRYAAPATLANLQKIVREGAYNAQGMPSFTEWVTAEDVDAIRAFILSQRAALMAAK